MAQQLLRQTNTYHRRGVDRKIRYVQLTSACRFYARPGGRAALKSVLTD
jgi:hypothetical protein